MQLSKFVGYLASLAVLCSMPAVAATLLGERGSGCIALAADGQHSIALTQSVAKGQTLLISAAQDNGSILVSSVSDSAGNSYLVGSQQQGSSTTVANAYANIDNALAAGATLTLVWSGAGHGAQSCIEVAAFGGISAVADPLLDSASNFGSSNSQFVTTSKDASEDAELVHVAFAYTGSAAPNFSLPTHALSSVCSSGNTFCLYPAYATGGSTSSPLGVSATTASSFDWEAVLVGLSTNVIFANGFQ
jgi:hypothetical protein